MDTTKKFLNSSPQKRANIISKLFFWWLLPFVKYGYTHDLEMKDIYNIRDSEMSEDLADRLEKNWKKVCAEAKAKDIKPSLLTAIRKTFLQSYIPSGILQLLRMLMFTYFMPRALDAFITYFGKTPRDIWTGIYLGSLVLSICFINFMIGNHSAAYNLCMGLRIRVACGALMYRKILKLNKVSLDNTDVGNVVNLLSNDLNRFDMAAEFLNHIWIMPVIAIVGTYVMYCEVGLIAFLGTGVMLLQSVPLQGYLSKLQGKFRFQIASKTDSRVKLMNEITMGIQVIKMYAWEKPFAKMVALLRKKEIDTITKTTYIKSLSTAIQVFTERLTLYIIIVLYVLMGNELDGGMVFSMAQVINSLQLSICILFPLALTALAEAKTSISRVEEFLLKEEKSDDQTQLNFGMIDRGRVKLQNVHASWTKKAIIETLIDISFELPPGSFCCIVGNVGSGKSSILQLLLKELPLSSGKMEANGRISYASQEPWLFVSNVRNNILFGQPFHKDKYYRVVKACALERDFDLFPYGDKTLVGENGVSLSGGQRARINLARAVYREADIYLLDDPLSAVDPHVSKQLMDSCLGEYLQDKTRILVTHQTQYLNQADFVLVVNNGTVEKFIKPADLSPNEIKLIRNISREDSLIAPKASEEIFKSTLSLKSAGSTMEGEDMGSEPEETDELIARGSIGFNVYKEYYRSGASTFFLLFEVFLLLIAQVFCNSCDLWVTFWTNNIALLKAQENITLHGEHVLANVSVTPIIPQEDQTATDLESQNITTIGSLISETVTAKSNIIYELTEKIKPENITEDIYVQVYTLFIILAIFLTILRSAVFFRICMKASKTLHNHMFSNILQAKMRFFDTNPSGRILNRFSNDMGVIDELLPMVSLMTLQILTVGGGIMVMIFLKSYFMIIPACVLLIIVIWLRKIFFKTSQDVKRLERIAKAPVFSYIAASLQGISTIRSANAQDMLAREFDAIQNEHTATNYLFIYSFQAFGFSLDIISFGFLSVIILQFILNPYALSGDVGLVLSQSLIVVALIQFGTRNTAEVANQMTSVERVLQYTKLDQEGPFESLPGSRPPKVWPEAGRIIFKNVYLRYILQEDPVLKNLNLQIEPGEKIGIVGRTGAGKSTLISALFRLAPIDGIIEIDGIDTSRIGLTDLRTKISIIPQEPILFSESVRYNLDPFGSSDDQSLWKALEAVELKNYIDSLSMSVSEGGSNFSAGQRQLICLARAIVRNNRILVMDEATANVDQQTDALIQKSIRANFKNCTVLTVAHRLNTIMDSDRVIVMDVGEMKEFAAPHELLQSNDSIFSSMVRETGSTAAKKLRQIAEEHYKCIKS